MKFSKLLFTKLLFSKIAVRTLFSFLAVMLMTGTAMAQGNPANGQTLFTQSDCNRCHTTSIFTKKDRKVTSLSALEAQVRRCDSNLNTNWFDDEIHDVTAYLNQQYYKF